MNNNNNPTFFQHHLPHAMPYMPSAAGSSLKKETTQVKNGSLTKTELKKTLQRLIQVSQEMDSTGKSLASVSNIGQLSQMQEKMARLGKEQAIIIKQISDTSENNVLKNEFVRLSTRIGEYQQQIKNCKTMAELEGVQKKMEHIVDAWINVFKDIAMDAIQSSK